MPPTRVGRSVSSSLTGGQSTPVRVIFRGCVNFKVRGNAGAINQQTMLQSKVEKLLLRPQKKVLDVLRKVVLHQFNLVFDTFGESVRRGQATEGIDDT